MVTTKRGNGKLSEDIIDKAIQKISDAQALISDAYTLLEPAMTNGALIVGGKKVGDLITGGTDVANEIGGMQCTCDEVQAELEELKTEGNKL